MATIMQMVDIQIYIPIGTDIKCNAKYNLRNQLASFIPWLL